MAELLTPNTVNKDDFISYMGFKLYRDDLMPEHMGIFTEGCTTQFGVRQVNAVGTIDFRNNQVAIQKGKRPDSLYVHGTRYEAVKLELGQARGQQLVGISLQDAQKKMHS